MLYLSVHLFSDVGQVDEPQKEHQGKENGKGIRVLKNCSCNRGQFFYASQQAKKRWPLFILQALWYNKNNL